MINTNNILIVDDEVDICLLLKNFLEKYNNKVQYSLTLKDGLKKNNLLKPSFVIIDHNLPDGLGIENIAEFKKENDPVQVIVISAMSNLESEALEQGADYFLSKPISFADLAEVIKD